MRKCMLEYCSSLTCNGPMYHVPCNWSMSIQSAVESLKASVWQNLVLAWLWGRNCSQVCMSVILCTWNAYQKAAGQTDPWSWWNDMLGFSMVAALLRKRELNKSSSQESGHPMICTDDPLEDSPVRCWAVAIPNRDAVLQHTLKGTMIEGYQPFSLQWSLWLCLLHYCGGVGSPVEICGDMYAQKPESREQAWELRCSSRILLWVLLFLKSSIWEYCLSTTLPIFELHPYKLSRLLLR